MAAGKLRKRLQEEATCSICLDFFRDPVTLECGHNFCRGCIDGFWGESAAEDASCPQCRPRAPRRSLKSNRQLANMVAIAKELSVHPGPEGGWRVCEWHQEPLNLFCRDDEAPICVICDRSKEHRGHEVVPLREAAQEYKDLIQERIDVVRKQKDEIAEAKRNSKLESQSLLRQVNAERQQVVAKFQELHQLMEGRKRLLLARLGELDKKVSKRTDEHNAELSKESTSLDNFIQELEEKCQQPASEFLQDVKNTLQRCNIVMPQISVAFPPEIKREIEDFSSINSFLQHVVTQFRDTEYQLCKVKPQASCNKDLEESSPIAKESKVTSYSGPVLPPGRIRQRIWYERGYSLGSRYSSPRPQPVHRSQKRETFALPAEAGRQLGEI